MQVWNSDLLVMLTKLLLCWKRKLTSQIQPQMACYFQVLCTHCNSPYARTDLDWWPVELSQLERKEGDLTGMLGSSADRWVESGKWTCVCSSVLFCHWVSEWLLATIFDSPFAFCLQWLPLHTLDISAIIHTRLTLRNNQVPVLF